MEYFVIGPDGNRYGPADLPILRQWVSEGRVTALTMLEDSSTGERIPATTLDGLFDQTRTAVADPTMYPPGSFAQQTDLSSQQYASYPRQSAGVDSGQVWIILSWVFSSFGLCCVIFAPLGLAFAIVGKVQGSPSWLPPLVFSAVVLALRVGLMLWSIGSAFGPFIG